MRISDWSSDVCSSDLPRTVAAERPITVRDIMRHTAGFAYGAGPTPAHDAFVAADPLALTNTLAEASRRIGGQIGRAHAELQSLMRISYAVFCLKKKKQK